jgi:hypothetical protein
MTEVHQGSREELLTIFVSHGGNRHRICPPEGLPHRTEDNDKRGRLHIPYRAFCFQDYRSDIQGISFGAMQKTKGEKGNLISGKAKEGDSRLSIKPGQEQNKTYLTFFSILTTLDQ